MYELVTLPDVCIIDLVVVYVVSVIVRYRDFRIRLTIYALNFIDVYGVFKYMTRKKCFKVYGPETQQKKLN